MKKTFLLNLFAVFLGGTFLNAQSAKDTVTNQTIIKMTKSKLGDKVILSKVKSSPCKFDISADALIKLKEQNVSDTVVNLMVYKQTYLENQAESTKNSSGDGGGYTFKSSGIYFLKSGKYTQLDPTLVTSSSTNGGCMAFYGLSSMKTKSQIEGKEANYQFENKPTFYFSFNPSNKNLNNSNASDNYMESILTMYGHGNQQAISPNEFRLIKLDVKGNRREYVSGEAKTNGSVDISIGDKYLADFKYSKVSEHTYKVEFPKGLAPGEYCFYYLSNRGTNPYLAGQTNNIKVFDFSVK